MTFSQALTRLKTGQLGAGWMVVASLLFALMGVFVKTGSAHFSAIELVFYRTLFGMLSIGVMVLARGQSLATRHFSAHLKRGLFGYFSLLLYFYAITQLPLATAVTLNYTSPMFLAGLSAWLLKETLGPRVVMSLGLGFAGVVLLLKPTFSADAWLAGAMGLGSGLFAGLAYLHVRELGRLGEPEWKVVFYFTLISTLCGLVMMLWQTPSPLGMESLGMLAGLGVTSTLAQLAMTRAYRDGNKFVVANLAYLTVVFSSALGAWLWGDVLPLEGYIAMGLIIVSGIFASRR